MGKVTCIERQTSHFLLYLESGLDKKKRHGIGSGNTCEEQENKQGETEETLMRAGHCTST